MGENKLLNKKHFGVMLDCSRNGVMKPEKIKEFVNYISGFGYNTLELYTEDTFEVENEPFFGYMRGRYTVDELKDIDAYCKVKGVELIPCIQTLAHLNAIFHWKEYSSIRDVKDIILVGEERTYQVIDNIFSTLSKAFTSRTVNIGMDEADLVGLGKYLKKFGYGDRFEILNKHLERVVEIAKKYGFSCVMWSDMFFNLLVGGYSVASSSKVKEKLSNQLPDGVNLTYWDYYNTDYKWYKEKLELHKIADNDCWFAGAVWSWRGFAPSNTWTIKTMSPAMKACINSNIDNVLITVWGDDGNDCSYFSALPTLFYISRIYKGENNLAKIKREFKEITGEDYNSFIAMGLPNVLAGLDSTFCPSKYICFSDIFNGHLDPFIPDDADVTYKKYARKLSGLAKKSKFNYLYDNLAKLCDFLSVKSCLGKRLRKAYQLNDLTVLNQICRDIKKAENKLEDFYDTFMNRWYIENKPQGGEVHDIRFGGLKQRLVACRKRLQAYLNGELSEIPELATDLLVEENDGFALSTVGMWVNMATVQPLKTNGY